MVRPVPETLFIWTSDNNRPLESICEGREGEGVTGRGGCAKTSERGNCADDEYISAGGLMPDTTQQTSGALRGLIATKSDQILD